MAHSSKRPCRFCRQWFRPNPRSGRRQYACSHPPCQAQRKRKNRRAWIEAHPGYFRNQYQKKRPWFQARPGYHASLRKRSPEIAARHRLREQERRRRHREEAVALQDAIRIQDALAQDLAIEKGGVAQPDWILIQLSIGQQLVAETPRVAQPDGMAPNAFHAYKRLHAIHRLAYRIRRRRHG